SARPARFPRVLSVLWVLLWVLWIVSSEPPSNTRVSRRVGGLIRIGGSDEASRSSRRRGFGCRWHRPGGVAGLRAGGGGLVCRAAAATAGRTIVGGTTRLAI